jgi:hypothetical protein
VDYSAGVGHAGPYRRQRTLTLARVSQEFGLSFAEAKRLRLYELAALVDVLRQQDRRRRDAERLG